MASLLPTETVTIEEKTLTGKDSIGEPIFSFTEHEVEGCLISPLSGVELAQSLALLEKVSFSVHLPSSFKIEGLSRAKVRGKWYRVVHEVPAVTRSPLQWDRSILVEASSEK